MPITREDIIATLGDLSPEARVRALRQALAEVESENARHRYKTPGDLAMALDPNTVQTPALEAIDEALVEAVETGGRLIITVPPQEGKLLAANTPVWTPDGWKNHGDLHPGDTVFHPTGHPITVTEKHPNDHATLRVHFSDHHHLDCHPNHEFTVWDRSRHKWRTVEAHELAATKLMSGTPGKRGSRYRFGLPHREALQTHDTNLPIPPYLLGLWLGNGKKTGGTISRDERNNYPYDWPVSSHWVQENTGVHYDHITGLTAALRAQSQLAGDGEPENKHIPASYLTASVEQRRALLAGLIDTDGHIPARGNQISFDNTNERLVKGVAHLARTLGYRAHVHEPTPPKTGGTINGHKVTGKKTMWRATFTIHDGQLPTRIDNHRDGRMAGDGKRRRVAITRVENITPVVGNCITVDSPDGLYLAGEGLTPTHNSTRVGVWLPVWMLMRDPDARVVVASYAESLAARNAYQARAIVAEHGSGAVDEVTGEALPDSLGFAIAKDNRQKRSWGVQGASGGYYATGTGGGLTGRAADLICIDDPLKNQQQADSARERQKVWEWWTTVAQTRLAPGAAVVIIMTRWHPEDLVGEILAEEAKLPETDRVWRVLNIPAIAEEGVPDALGREPGVALQSARGRTKEEFERIRRAVGPRAWAALYQGQPEPSEGGLFVRDEFEAGRVASADLVGRVVSVDPAESGVGDEAGLLLMGWDADGVVYVEEDLSRPMASATWARESVRLAVRSGAAAVVYEAFTTEQTYRDVLESAWREIAYQARLLRECGGDTVAAAERWHMEGQPGDTLTPMQRTLEILDVMPTSGHMPFRLVPWRKKGDKVARAAGARQSVTIGRLRMIGVHAVLERQGVSWQPGQGSPDRVDAMVNGHDFILGEMGRPAEISFPGDW